MNPIRLLDRNLFICASIILDELAVPVVPDDLDYQGVVLAGCLFSVS